MKKLISNYVFDASLKKVTFTDYANISLEGVLLITNVVDNIIIYNFADPLRGGTVGTNVLTLTYNTTSMSDSDTLQIFYDDAIDTLTNIQTELEKKADLTETQSISGNVSISNFPVTQTVSGGVSINNLPDTQAVSGSILVTNFPATQPVSGSISVSNFPATQPVSGSISVSNFPATQAVSAASLPLPTGASTSDNQTNGDQLVQLVDGNKTIYSSLNPIPTDGDSIYVKDLDTARCSASGWTGDLTSPFYDLHELLYNNTGTSPKVLEYWFHRTLYCNAIALGCANTGYHFNNLKIEFLGSDGTVRNTQDYSSNNTQYGTAKYEFKESIACVAIRLSFYTTNTIGITNISIQKEIEVKSKIRTISDTYGFYAENTPGGNMRIAQSTMLTGSTYTGNTIDSNFVTTTTTSGGSATQLNGEITMSTGTSANGSASIQNVRVARYAIGNPNRLYTVVRCPDGGTANNLRKWGVFNDTDGAYFKLNGTTFSVATMKAGVETDISYSLWNGGSNAFLFDTLVHRYEIIYMTDQVYFIIDGTLCHNVSATTSAGAWTGTLHLPGRLTNTNINGSTTNVTLVSRGATIQRFGPLETQPTSKFQSGTTAGIVCKYSTGNLRGLNIAAVTNNARVILYDNITAGGTVLFDTGAMTAQTIPFSLSFYSKPFLIGLTLVISGAACNVDVIYE